MIVKGLIKSIDYNGNTCQVRLPLFESSSKSEVVLPAIISSQPGLINNYKENDVVLVAFENNSLDAPVIVGKLYLGSGKENNDARGALAVTSLKVTKKASLPLSTQLTFEGDTSNYTAVNGGVSTYKTLADLVAALQSTEKNYAENKSTLNNQVSTIKVTYLETTELPETFTPSKDDPRWSTTMPTWKDGYYIWQKTTCYNNRGLILGDPEILCLSSIAITPSYWLRRSTSSHVGNQQKENNKLEITAMVKLGTSQETIDKSATLEYVWSDGSKKEPETESSAYQLVFKNTVDSPIPNADLIITAKHKGVIYEQETIMFAPLNTPVLVLSNENDSIEYDSYGFNKIKLTASVSSTAAVLLNNKPLEGVSFKWRLKDCSNAVNKPTEDSYATDQEVEAATLTIYHIAEAADKATATCIATYLDNLGNEQQLSKVFSISKTKLGRAPYTLDIFNDFVSIPLDYNTPLTDLNMSSYNTEHTVTAFYGDEPIDFYTVNNISEVEVIDNRAFYLQINTNGLSLNPATIEGTTNEFTTEVKTLTNENGYVLYTLYRGDSKVASGKFEVTVNRKGVAATNLWLIISNAVHTGSQQEDSITIQPKIQIGNAEVANNTESYVECSYINEQNEKIVLNCSKDSTTGCFTITDPLPAANIKVIASQNTNLSNPYEEEEITYSPLNTPVIDLTNDSDDLVYTPGGTKIDENEIATSTASLWLNGEKLDAAQFAWSLVGCKGTYITSSDKKDTTVTITDLTSPKGTATCTATYKGQDYSKTFSVAKQIQGDASVAYWLKTSTKVHTGTENSEDLIVTAMRKVGEDSETPDTTACLWYKFASDTSWSKNNGHIINILKNDIKDSDFIIYATHSTENTLPSDEQIFDRETITYSPRNTPVIDLSSDGGYLPYDADGNIIGSPIAQTTADLYLNGDVINAEAAGLTYVWTDITDGAESQVITFDGSTNQATIRVKEISKNTATAKCVITVGAGQFKDKTYSKEFKIVRQIKGDPTTSYELLPYTRNIKIAGDGTLVTTSFDFQIIKRSGGKTPEAVNIVAPLKVRIGVDSASLTDFNGTADSNKKYSISTSTVSDYLTIVLYDGDTEIDRETIDVIKDGSNGESTYKLEIENDFVSIPSDFNGTIHLDDSTVSDLTTHRISLSYGSDLQDISECIIGTSEPDESSLNKGIVLVGITSTGIVGANADPVNSSNLSGVYKGTITNLTEDIGSIIYKAYVEGTLVATAKFEAVKVKSGEPTTYYKLETDCTSIVCHGTTTGTNGKISYNNTPEYVQIYCYKYSGGEKTQVENFFIEYKVDGGETQLVHPSPANTTHPKYANFPTSDISDNLYLKLYLANDSGTPNDYADDIQGASWDSETINVVKDGEDGKSAYKIDVANDFVTIPTDYSGTIQLETSTLQELTTHIVTLYYGEETIKPNWISSEAPNNTMGLKYTISSGLTTSTIPTSSSENNTLSIDVTDLIPDTGSILYEIINDGKTLASAKFVASKLKSGEPTSYYKLEPSSSIIVHHKDGTNSPDELKIYCYKYTGSTKEQVQNFWIRYFIDNGNPQTIHATPTGATHKGYAYFKSTTGITKSLKVELYLQKLNSPTDLNGAPLIDQETIVATTDGVDGVGGDTLEVQQAFLWTSDYTYIPELPSSLDSNKTEWEKQKEWAFIPTTKLTKEKLDTNTPAWKLIFISTRVKTTSAAGEVSYSPWDAPAIYLCKNEDSYRRETTAEGLFGHGQGIYYTVINTVADRFTAGEPYDPKDLAAYVTEDPENNKENVTVYINAEYIKTGAFTVKDGDDILFQAGLDQDKNNEPVVQIAGFKVSPSRMVNVKDSGSGVGIAPESGHGCWAMWAGEQSGDGTEVKPYGYDAPFRVGHGGELTATNANISGTINANSGKIGGFSLTSTEFKTIREDESTTSGTATDVLITNADQDYWSKVASQGGTNWRIIVGKNFGVDVDGKLSCADACINGTVNATAGSLKGITDIETLTFSGTDAYSTNLSSDAFTTRTLTTSAATIAGIKIDSTNTSNIKEKDTQKVTIKLDPGIVAIGASSSSFTSDIASYIGGSWIFYLKFKTTGGEIFTSQRIFTGYRVDWAVFQSDSKKTTGSGSNISSEYITTKVYFNNAAIYTNPGYDSISMSNTGGGNGASPSAKWRLVQISLKKYGKDDIAGTGAYNTLTQTYTSSNAGRYETVRAVDIKANQTITSSYLRITGGLYPNRTDAGESSSFNIGDISNKWDNMYSDKVYATTFYASSDKRLKENIKDYVPKNSILNLPVVEFDFKESGTHQIGCIAQDLQEICPELVSKNENGYLSISENKLVYLLLLELKKLNTKVINLEQQLENERNN